MYTSTVTQKGQATIPAPIRIRLGIKPGQKVLFEEKGKDIVIRNQANIVDELYGSIKTNIKWDKKKAYEAVGKMLAKRHLKSLE
ncbi:hypothetical protein A2617_01875 [Candidatus Daviesbacteria bacterium RIFOXYD1_FULL_41_10]|uniref:SpoVT-AbrB domain-containing protein n=2 Tax=Candidatus Daviesiibacteriota TaxID=1752718 RepID=A0A1F5N0Z3_9BACT|nr:MAG: Transcriptional regulator, AbrB family [Candidatus Daviesbacteria bacterium GW2011_GWB1_41_5]OGE71252.1 MAG: hypothetical protein A2617_01875 [Candidatus Daviesbacteria bacterium RIFOXYD1_FULL_41_10]